MALQASAISHRKEDNGPVDTAKEYETLAGFSLRQGAGRCRLRRNHMPSIGRIPARLGWRSPVIYMVERTYCGLSAAVAPGIIWYSDLPESAHIARRDPCPVPADTISLWGDYCARVKPSGCIPI